MTRKNLRVRLGDVVTVHEAADVKYATVVHVLPYAEDLEGVTGETFETFLQPFFEGGFKPVSSGLALVCLTSTSRGMKAHACGSNDTTIDWWERSVVEVGIQLDS